jgi:hypothetical protein
MMSTATKRANASPVRSETLRVTIWAHRSAQAKVDRSVDGAVSEDVFGKACSAAEATLWSVAKTPCSNDGDFFEKVSYLLGDARRELGEELFSHDLTLAKLAFAIEMHLEQRAA